MKPNLVARASLTRSMALLARLACTLALASPILGASDAKAQSLPFATRDWKTSGDHALVLDRNTGLEWLSLGSSFFWGYTTIVGQFGAGGAFEGFRHATVNEVVELWSHAGVGTVHDASPVYLLQQLFGI